MMEKVSIFHITLFGGLIFLLLALVVIDDDPAMRWYLIGMAQMMLGVGLVGTIIGLKKKD